MNDTPRRYAALDLTWPSPVPEGFNWLDRLSVALDGLDVAAIQESDLSWRVFFPTADVRDRAARILREHFRGSGLAVASVEIPDEDWARRTQADLQPVRVGRLIVAPPWAALSASKAAGATIIRILPSMGFGTGHHPTTRLCLLALQAVDLADRSFLDIGTGSGVLAIAACLLGATPVTAIDSDPDAVDSARENLRLNGVHGRVNLATRDLRVAPSATASVVAANLTGGTLVQARFDLTASVDPGGLLVVSGFLQDEADAVLQALAGAGGRLTTRYDEDGWSAAVLGVCG